MEHTHCPKLSDSAHAHSHSAVSVPHVHTHRPRERRRLAASMIITAAMMVIEIIGGIWTNSLALLSDAGHMFTHLFALGLSYIAMVLAARPTTQQRSFGLYRLEILAAFVNGIVLAGVTCFIVYEAAQRFIEPLAIKQSQMLIIASAGLLVNLISAFLLAGVGKDDLNVKSAFLHMVGDAASSVAIIIGAVLIYFTGWTRIDSLLSALIAAVIGLWSYRLIRDSAHILMEGTPKKIDIAKIKQAFCQSTPEIEAVHDIHVWEITSSMYSLTSHVVVSPQLDVERLDTLRNDLNQMLDKKFDITHSTFQFESAADSHQVHSEHQH